MKKIEYEGKKYRIVNSDYTCDGCVFNESNNCTCPEQDEYNIFPDCGNVIFKEVAQ